MNNNLWTADGWPAWTASGWPGWTASGYIPFVAAMRVQAVAAGSYNGEYRDIGDVFDLQSTSDYSAYNVSQVQPGDPIYPVYGWMMTVPSTTPLFSYASSGLSSPRTAPRRTVE